MINEPQVKAPTTMSVGLKYGLFLTGISIVGFVIRAIISGNPMERSTTWMVVGIAATAIVLILGQREFKNNGDGYMTYGQGFMIGFWMTLVSLIIYGLFIALYANIIDTNLMENVYQAQQEEMEARPGATPEQIEMGMTVMKKFFWAFFVLVYMLFCLIEVLIVTIFTQKSNPNPAM